MKKVDITEIDTALNDFPGYIAKFIKVSLDTKNAGKNIAPRLP